MPRTTEVPSDFLDLVAAFDAEGVEHMIVGGYAFGAHVRPRTLEGVDFASARARAERFSFGGLPSVPHSGLDDLIANERAVGRKQDLADVEHLERAQRRRAGTS